MIYDNDDDVIVIKPILTLSIQGRSTVWQNNECGSYPLLNRYEGFGMYIKREEKDNEKRLIKQ